ncbi:putative Sequence-specific DNA binding transcription factor [Hibiscus syriacus]|uniref:Sequence-specific DNA binding transcription factor n=1 Tax=Hibiscus syriacus TaxID=106335 RepID=A0A6A2X7K3_HIBSY|nr:putative Sequence-specific DNA binding transcription factor [Hibiscus syriacus]
MCSYHNGNRLHLPHDPDLLRSFLFILKNEDDSKLPDSSQPVLDGTDKKGGALAEVDRAMDNGTTYGLPEFSVKWLDLINENDIAGFATTSKPFNSNQSFNAQGDTAGYNGANSDFSAVSAMWLKQANENKIADHGNPLKASDINQISGAPYQNHTFPEDNEADGSQKQRMAHQAYQLEKQKYLKFFIFLFAYAIMVPLALIFERKSLEKINGKIVFQSFLLWIIRSLVYTSATFVAAMINLAPACTFILAICFKYISYTSRFPDGETGNKNKSRAGKSVWDINRNRWSNVVHILQRYRDTHLVDTFKPFEASPTDEKSGNITVVTRHQQVRSRCIFWSFELRFILFVVDHTGQNECKIPLPLFKHCFDVCNGRNARSCDALCTVFSMMSANFGHVEDAVLQGILGSALLVFLVSCAVRLMGPLYASIFNPLGLVFVAVLGSLLLDEELYLGSIIGGLMIVCGVYVVLWGKAKEMKQKTQLVPVPTVDSHEATEEDKQSEIKETDEEDIEAPHAIVLA